MRNGKYQSRKQGFNARPVALLLAVVLLIGVSVGGTLAWLTDKTEEVTNTFTAGDINITLAETKTDFKMIPGWTIDKDPVVTVEAGSEDCWVFVKVEKSENLDSYISYTIDPNNWTVLDNEDGVYYCKVTDVEADRTIKVLGYTDTNNQFHPNQVLVKDTVTKEMMDEIDGVDVAEGTTETKPMLTFTAYAVQLYKSNGVEFEVSEAWTNAQNAANQQTGTTN